MILYCDWYTVTVSLCLSAFIESLGCDQDYTSFSGTVSSPSSQVVQLMKTHWIAHMTLKLEVDMA